MAFVSVRRFDKATASQELTAGVNIHDSRDDSQRILPLAIRRSTHFENQILHVEHDVSLGLACESYAHVWQVVSIQLN